MTEQPSSALPAAVAGQRRPANADAHVRSWSLALGAGALPLLLGVLVAAQLTIVGHRPGLGAALFVALLVAAIAIRHRAARSAPWLAVAIVSVAMLVEAANAITLPLAAAALVCLAADRAATWPRAEADRPAHFLSLFLLGPLTGGFDLVRVGAGALRRPRAGSRGFGLAGAWLLPLAVATLFVLLFLPANPWLDTSLSYLLSLPWLRLPSLSTIVTWLLVALAVWPLLRLDAKRPPAIAARIGGLRRLLARIVARDRTVAVLVLFNGVFLIQTLSDAIGLWPTALLGAGTQGLLPQGTTYSQFARAGAYPLLVATLIAAAIILHVLRETAVAGASRAATALILAWIVQTMLLEASAAMRLGLYVDAYGLTRMRLATFIGMGMIGAGLALAVWRLAAGRSNRWLVLSCALVLAVTAFACGFADLDAGIADYNVARAERARAAGRMGRLDQAYLCRLGASALPAIERALAAEGARTTSFRRLRTCYPALRARLAHHQQDWHSWSWRGARILAGLNASVAIRSSQYVGAVP